VLLVTAIGAGYAGALKAPSGPLNKIIGAALAGLVSGAALSLLIFVGPTMGLGDYLLNASRDLYDLIAGVEFLGIENSREMWKGEAFPTTFWFPAAVGLSLGTLGGLLSLLPRVARNLIFVSAGALIIAGLLAGIVRSSMLQHDVTSVLARDLFASNGLRLPGVFLVLGLVVLVYLVWVLFEPRRRYRQLPKETREHPALRVPAMGIALLFVLLLPLGFTGFIPSVIALVALYALMGLGLNITLGLAGLLDLGFVAFFAVGAYTLALLTSTGGLGIAELSFFVAIPLAILAAMGFGLLLGLPILGIRGDYLAIATLGFGEIIAILARSDLLKPFIGGPSGITSVPKPLASLGIEVGPDSWLAGPNQIYYVSLISIAVIAFVAVRLRDSRLGRAWVAIREDEDVAEALGINLVQTKTLAYMLGAAFAGLGGAVFAAHFGSIQPSSININVSILIVTIIIIGGMGSIPGVVLGAIVIIGLPELLRGFAEEYRFLFYGIALILVVRWRPEGLMPSKVGTEELHHEEGSTMQGNGPPSPDETGADAAPGVSGGA
jgi:branched-chain amino acid transport system permease protein